jgi:hypothetical protein
MSHSVGERRLKSTYGMYYIFSGPFRVEQNLRYIFKHISYKYIQKVTSV